MYSTTVAYFYPSLFRTSVSVIIKIKNLSNSKDFSSLTHNVFQVTIIQRLTEQEKNGVVFHNSLTYLCLSEIITQYVIMESYQFVRLLLLFFGLKRNFCILLMVNACEGVFFNYYQRHCSHVKEDTCHSSFLNQLIFFIHHCFTYDAS